MNTLRKDVYNSVIVLHRKTGKEWIPLKEIYNEVERVRGELKNKGASVRAVLETHSVLSDAFTGTEEYVLKEKGTGLYKSVHYDQIKFIESLTIGDVFTRDQLMKIFKISGQSGIMPTTTLNCLVITTSEENGVYDDSSIENGLITYTGEGKIGDQKLERNNKLLYESKENDLPVYLFSKDKNKKYVFEGRVELYDTPYRVLERDIEGNDRSVLKFPLSIVYPNDYDYETDEKFKEIAYEIVEIENRLHTEMPDEFGDLEYREGKINIRKFRKTDKKIQRTNRPDYIAEEIMKTNQGIINEKVIYERELKRLVKAEAVEQIKEMKEFFENRKDNEGYDILSFELDENGKYIEKYIEVKSTKGNEATPIDISSNELEFARKHVDNYYLYRIINSDSKDRYLKVVNGRDLLNDIDYDFIPTSYRIYSK